MNDNIYRLSKYLLKSAESLNSSVTQYSTYSNAALQTEMIDTIKKLKSFHDPGLTVFKHYQSGKDSGTNIRHFKAAILEEEEVYDKNLLLVLKEFCYIGIALLISLEKQHNKNIFSGKLTPHDFLYNKKRRKCAPFDRDTNLAANSEVHVEKQEKGELKFFQIDFFHIADNKYLAPELRDSMHVYNLQRKLKNMLYAVEERGVKLQHDGEIKALLNDFYQRHAKYTNKAEIYSIGYSLNVILSHLIEKLAMLNMFANEFPAGLVADDLVKEADALLPDAFENHGSDRAVDLLNEAVHCVHCLMHEQVEKRDSLPEGIAKLKAILKRIKAKSPTGSVLEREEEESEEHDELMEDLWFEEYEEYEGHEEHEDHAHASHGDHEHDEHKEHASHDAHDEHDHHEAHEEHEHEEHAAHEKHEHEEHDQHEAHEEHEHEEHAAHEEHEHEEHAAHEEHEHEEHAAHEEHEHEEHAAHEDHEHEEHAAHEEHEHEEHTTHEEHAHEEHAHEQHSHSEHAHEENGSAHSASAHEDEQHAALKHPPGSRAH